ncbi:putative S-locus lectin protein kinase family protein [Quillaja saponaria]|uniref:S-locus lectin protein kinase family protein n=1 Tax=Quillaja saponaria TaxID=32244 RepID=A0AAD7PYR2_QUISA|nr:putative S-locus lectin protein kinase family protein [Quillaja saponaria]
MKVDFIVVIDELCYVGSLWKITNGVLVSFGASQLKAHSQTWYYFLLGNILPTSNASDVTRDRALLLYAIMKGMNIDVGKIIRSAILQSANGKHLGLCFLFLITELCFAAGFQWDDS